MWVRIVSQGHAFRRFLFLLFLLFIGTLVGIHFILKSIKLNSDEQIELSFTKEGGTIIFKGNEFKGATFNLAASDRWTNSGIEVAPQATVRIKVGGKVHLAVHRLINSANADNKDFEWNGPYGRDINNTQPQDFGRYKARLHSKAKLGALLIVLHQQGEPEPNLETNPNPEQNMYFIDSDGIIDVTNKSQQKASLWFIVNDVLIDKNNLQEAKNIYISEKLSDEEKEIYKKRWEYIVSEDYWDVWWDDNIGYFFISVEPVQN